MEPAKLKTRGPSKSYTFELPYDNDLDQDEFNRTHRKPGEPGYKPPAKNQQPPTSPPNSSQTEPNPSDRE